MFVIEDLEQYEARRLQALQDMADHKRARRMAIAEDISLLWESQKSIQHQVQEMARMESDDPEALEEILSGYEDIFPRPGRLSATLYVEVVEQSRIKTRLGYYAGLEHSVRLASGGVEIPGTIIGDHGTEEATTAVTYLVFEVPEDLDLSQAEVVVDHPRVQVRMPLPDAVREHPIDRFQP